MKNVFDIKNQSLCSKHFSSASQRSNVCCHVKSNLESNEKPLIITPLFIERVLLEKFYEKYWICRSCAENFSISNNGELWFDPNIRNFFEGESEDSEETDEFVINIEDTLKTLIVQTCRSCLLEKYGDQVHFAESSIESFKQRPVTK